MKDMLLFIAILISFLVLFFGNYMTFATQVIKWSKKPVKGHLKGKTVMKQPECTGKENLMCCIPVWQAVEVRKALYGSAGLFGPLSILALALMLFNLIVSFLLPINALLLLMAHYCFYIGFLLAWFIYGFVTADCARLYEFSWFTIVLNAIGPNIFCFWLKNNIPHIMCDLRKQKTFEEDHDTVIKQKYSS